MSVSFVHADSAADASALWAQMQDPATLVFVLFYMSGCGPCNATRPEWRALSTEVRRRRLRVPRGLSSVVIADVNEEYLSSFPDLPRPPSAFPTIECVHLPTRQVDVYQGERTAPRMYAYIQRRLDAFAVRVQGGGGVCGGRRARSRRPRPKLRSCARSQRRCRASRRRRAL